MEGKDTEQQSDSNPREDDRNDAVEGTPVPDPEEERGSAEDDPQAD